MDKIKVLVVEDEAVTAMDIQERLIKLGYNVPIISDTGEEAIKMTNVLQPNVILMDIVLKGEIEGTQAAYEISKQCRIPIIFLTAYKDEETFKHAKQSQPYGYLTKPFETRELSSAIEIALLKHDAEERILAAEERYRSVMENAACGIFIMDKEGVISEFNKQIQAMFGASYKQIIGKNFRSFLDQSEQDYLSVQINKVLNEKIIGPNQCSVQPLNGGLRDIEFTAVYVNNDREKFIFCILNDVTERNRLRKQAVLADKLATVGTLTAGIIHEVNNPLTYVLGNLEYINEQISAANDESTYKKTIFELKDIIDVSIKGIQEISSIIKELKGYTRLEQKELSAVNVHEAIQFAINMAYPQFHEVTQLKTDFADNIPLLFLDNHSLQQVFLNLIVNAAQAMELNQRDNNCIIIKTRLEDDRIRIDISDTGKGMTAEVISKIFEPFYTTKSAGAGTGLGLSICSDIINSIGGEIYVESTLGVGSAFSIYLPIQLKITAADEVNKPVLQQAPRKKIIVIDDEPTLLIIMKRVLEKHHEVMSYNSRAALEFLVKNSDDVDAIVTDLNMPDVNGIDLYNYVAANIPRLKDRMIFVTGGTYTPAVKEFLASVDNICLTKPFTSEQLRQAINRVFSA